MPDAGGHAARAETAAAPLASTALLALLQLADTSAPIGGYAHSYGLEGLAQEGMLRDGRALRQVLDAAIRHSISNADMVGVVQAFRAAAAGDPERAIALDILFSAQKVAREAREASVGLGKRLLANAANLSDSPLLDAYRAHLAAGGGHGHHCIVFGLVTHALGIDEQPAAVGFGYTVVAGALSAALRLGILGQSEAQVVLREQWPLLESAANRARTLAVDEIASFGPAIEIATMRHERAYSRLFAS